jgi:hypothetical protein
MTERTVTDKQVINALVKLGVNFIHNPMAMKLMDELFPERPKLGELILVWNKTKDDPSEEWVRFVKISPSGDVIFKCLHSGVMLGCTNYRRQTPAERGEG